MKSTGYENYGISKALVDRVKQRLKNPLVKQQVKSVLENVSKQDLRKKERIRDLIIEVSGICGIHVNTAQMGGITRFVLDQKIDPKNKFHLIKLWNTFR